MDKLNRMFLIAVTLMIFSTLFDSLTTYTRFQDDYDDTMSKEMNPYITEAVQKYGVVIGCFCISLKHLIAYILAIFLGSFIYALFFFDDFKEEKYSYADRVYISISMGAILIASIGIGAGLQNLIGLFM